MQEAQLKVDQMASQGWEAVSVGAGGRAAGGAGSDQPGLGQGNVVDVVVLMRRSLLQKSIQDFFNDAKQKM